MAHSHADHGHGHDHDHDHSHTPTITSDNERKVLLCHAPFQHSYPHCWRSKTPVIFRGMDQWFINIDHEGFRQTALAAIDEGFVVDGASASASAFV